MKILSWPCSRVYHHVWTFYYCLGNHSDEGVDYGVWRHIDTWNVQEKRKETQGDDVAMVLRQSTWSNPISLKDIKTRYYCNKHDTLHNSGTKQNQTPPKK